MNPRRIKGARGTRWRKGSLSHTWSQLVQLMPTGTSRRYRADHSPTRVCAHTPVLATISVPRTRTLTKQKAAGPTGPAAFSFSKCQRHCRSEAVHLMFAARQRSPEGLGDLPQGLHTARNLCSTCGSGFTREEASTGYTYPAIACHKKPRHVDGRWPTLCLSGSICALSAL